MRNHVLVLTVLMFLLVGCFILPKQTGCNFWNTDEGYLTTAYRFNSIPLSRSDTLFYRFSCSDNSGCHLSFIGKSLFSETLYTGEFKNIDNELIFSIDNDNMRIGSESYYYLTVKDSTLIYQLRRSDTLIADWQIKLVEKGVILQQRDTLWREDYMSRARI